MAKAVKNVPGKDKKDKRPNRETNVSVLKQAMVKRLPRRVSASGQMVLPAAPSLLDHYTENLQRYFATLGRVFTKEETEHMRGLLEKKLKEAFTASPYARVIVSYETDAPPKTSLTYRVTVNVSTIGDEYETWVKTRTPPFFGALPDAKVMDLARSLGQPDQVAVLDIGAGTGRNTLPLAREGFRIDAIELTPALANILRADVAKENLSATVYEADALAGAVALPERHYGLVFLSEVIASHIRNTEQLRALFEGAADALRDGGYLLFNAFLPKDGYKPDSVARELSQVFWCNLFTRGELSAALQGLPFALVSDESAAVYEQEHLPAEAWPPTGWYADWAAGLDLFDVPRENVPMELRWLVYQRRA
jgi:SAM-dependent methyltransferase